MRAIGMRAFHGACCNAAYTTRVIKVMRVNQPHIHVARVTGLEPATSGVTGRRSNQLSYTRIVGRSI